jgi:hypothetical protein
MITTVESSRDAEMSLFEKVEQAQALLDQAYARLLQVRAVGAGSDALHGLHAATEEALSEVRTLILMYERLSARDLT